MMNKEEEKLDKFLAQIIQKDSLESPPSVNYTSVVMSEVMAVPFKARSAVKNMIVVGGVLLYLFLGGVVYYLWQIGWLSGFLSEIELTFYSLQKYLTIEVITAICVAVGVYMVAVRSLLAFFILKKGRRTYTA